VSAPYDLVGLGSLSANTKIKIYPNPATTNIFIESDMPVNASISTLQGKQVMVVESAKDIDIRNLPNGLYMIQIYDKDNNVLMTEKLVKNNP